MAGELGDLGSRLREERERARISQRELARRLGVSASLISQIESGQSKPSVSTLYAIVTELTSRRRRLPGSRRRAVDRHRRGSRVRQRGRREAGRPPDRAPRGRARLRRHLGATDEPRARGRRLPPRDLRRRRIVGVRRATHAASRSRVRLRARGGSASSSGSSGTSWDPATRSRSTRPRPIASGTSATRRSTGSGSSSDVTARRRGATGAPPRRRPSPAPRGPRARPSSSRSARPGPRSAWPPRDVLEIGSEQGPRGLERSGRAGPAAVGHHRDQQRLPVLGQRLVAQAHHVLAPAAEDLLAPGLGRLGLRELEHRASVVLDELVRRVERRRVGGDAHPGPDAERVDRRAAADQTVELDLVEPASREDPNVRRPGVVVQGSSATRQLAEVAAVEPDREVVREAELLDHLDRGPNAVQRVVGVDEERRPVVVAGEGPTPPSRRERLDGMRHRPRRLQAVPPGRLDVAGRHEPHDRRAPSGRERRVETLSAGARSRRRRAPPPRPRSGRPWTRSWSGR